MDYQQARSIRKSSLLSLIAERKFEDGQGIGSSIGGAISDKFKAKATGFKESLDPLNFVRKLTGKGAVGDIAVTGLGRLFGRKDKDIQAFGGYGRKRLRGKKDPQFTTLNSGPIKPLKVGDSSADILGKMYNFMRKVDEINVRDMEIERAFRQEQMDEDERRHRELVKAIKAFTKKNKSDGKDEKNIGTGLGIAGIAELLYDMRKGLANTASKFLRGAGNAAKRAGKFFIPKKALEKFTNKPTIPKTPIMEEPAPKGKIGGKGSRTPPPRGSSQAKSNLKANRASRSVPMRETAKSYTRVEKAVNAAKPVAKTALKASTKVIKGVGGLLKFLASVPGLNTLAAGGVAYLEIQAALDAYKAGKISEDEVHKRIVQSVGGAIGAVAGGTIGGAVGFAVGGPIGGVLGGIAGGVYAGAKGEYAAALLYDYFAGLHELSQQEKDDAIAKLSKFRQEHPGAMHGIRTVDQAPRNEATTKTTEPESLKKAREGISNFAKDYKEKLKGSAGKGRGYSPTQNSTNIPVKMNPESMQNNNQPVIATNNQVNNFGGKPAKFVSLDTNKQRNTDLYSHLTRIAVAV
jgi:hypothetical protein